MTATETKPHNRTTPEGRNLGEQIARLCDVEALKLMREGEWNHDERCASCAFRKGTVPNGCPQTLMDAMKCLMEKVPFHCHVGEKGEAEVCSGWFASMQAIKDKPKTKCDWEFSPHDVGYDC